MSRVVLAKAICRRGLAWRKLRLMYNQAVSGFFHDEMEQKIRKVLPSYPEGHFCQTKAWAVQGLVVHLSGWVSIDPGQLGQHSSVTILAVGGILPPPLLLKWRFLNGRRNARCWSSGRTQRAAAKLKNCSIRALGHLLVPMPSKQPLLWPTYSYEKVLLLVSVNIVLPFLADL